MHMEIDPEEWEEMKKTLASLEAKTNSVFNVITGNDPFNKMLPLVERVNRLERAINFIRVLLIGIGLGILVGGLIFGVLTLKQVVEAIKVVK